MAWQDYLSDIGAPKFSGDDCYGMYTEYECSLTWDAEREASLQVGEYLPTDDCFMYPVLRRYEDGSTRIWLHIETDPSCGGGEHEETFALPPEVLADLDTIYLDF